eukprot:CAMPEP_0115121028 /NCGR_PEP_ID=MMETSP0227-20121206/46023_1 /TAXON_ID=89957 /ORGANISM="Polarella glacialis, Strain CCMP 1383" /LENGTH=139 /DNA_ID=CAMNT_0002522771 /DNA_START=254 /DNA_END=670 /DNA_ORIENTATION=+
MKPRAGFLRFERSERGLQLFTPPCLPSMPTSAKGERPVNSGRADLLPSRILDLDLDLMIRDSLSDQTAMSCRRRSSTVLSGICVQLTAADAPSMKTIPPRYLASPKLVEADWNSVQVAAWLVSGWSSVQVVVAVAVVAV